MSIDYRKRAYTKGAREWVDNVLYPYLSRSATTSHDDIIHVIDYINSLRRYPVRISYRDARIKADRWYGQQNPHHKGAAAGQGEEKDSTLYDSGEDVEEVIRIDHQHRVVRLMTRRDLRREGRIMRHCIAGYPVNSGSTHYSIRKNENTPLCTIEIRDGSVIQARGRRNGSLSPEMARIVMHFISRIGIVKVEGLYGLGYVHEDSDMGRYLTGRYMELETVGSFIRARSGRRICENSQQRIGAVLSPLPDSYFSSLLTEAVRYNHVDMIRLLASEGAHRAMINDADMLLYEAASMGHRDTIILLWRLGVDIKRHSMVAVVVSAARGDTALLSLLSDMGADLHAGEGRALQAASETGKLAAVRFLLSVGARVSASGYAAILTSFMNGHLRVTRCLLEMSRPEEYAYIIETMGEKLLSLAAREGDLRMISTLLSEKIPADTRDSEALRIASHRGHLDIVELLHKKGASIESVDNEAVVYAIARGHGKVAAYLISRGADPMARSGEGVIQAIRLQETGAVAEIVGHPISPRTRKRIENEARAHGGKDILKLLGLGA